MVPLTSLTTEYRLEVAGKPSYIYRCSMPSLSPESPAWAYLASIGFKNWETLGGVKVSRRGSPMGNLTSFAASKLLAEIRITPEEGQEHIELIVDTSMQDFTQYNQLEIALELWTLLQVVAEGKSTSDESIRSVWKSYWKSAKRSFWMWILTIMTRGRHLDNNLAFDLGELLPNWSPAAPVRSSATYSR